MTSPADLTARIDALVSTTEALAANVSLLLRLRRRLWVVQSAIAFALSAGVVVSFVVIDTNNRHAEARTTCEAVNKTNAALLHLLDSAQAATPTTAPAGSNPAQVQAYAEQLRRSDAFIAQTHRDLAAKAC